MKGNHIAKWLLVTGLLWGIPLGAYQPQAAVAQSAELQEAERLEEQILKLYREGRYREAIPLAEHSLAIRKKVLGINHRDVATSFYNLAFLYQEQGNYATALPLFEQSLVIRERVLGANHPDVASTLNSLGRLYRTQGNYAQALLFYQRSLAIQEKILGTNHPDVASTLNNLGELYKSQGNYSQAVLFYQRGLAILEKNFGADHPKVATTLNNLAAVYHDQGNYAQALPLYQRSLAIRQKVFGANHPDVANILNNLGVLYHAQGNYDQALAMLHQSLVIRQKTLGVAHPIVAVNLNNLAGVYHDLGNDTLALSLYQSSLAIREKYFGTDHLSIANIVNNLAGMYHEQKNYAAALPLYQRSLAIWEKGLGSHHPNVAASLNNLAALYHAQGNYAQALPLYQRAVEVEETHLARNLVVGSEAYKHNFLSQFRGSTDTVISFHLQFVPQDLQAARLALTTILRRKGRILDALSETTHLLRQRLNPNDQQQFDRIASLRTQIATFSLSPEASNKTDQIKQLTAQAEQLEADLSQRSREFAQQSQPVTIAAVQKAIPTNAALVEFIKYISVNPKGSQNQRWGAPRYAVYVLRATGDVQWADLGAASEIESLITQYRQSLVDPRRLGDLRPAARALDAKIMAPVRKLVGNAEHLLIAPDDQLNLVTFAALMDEQDKYLLERYLITYLTSGRDLLRLQSTPPPAAPPLIVADPIFDQPGKSTVQVASATRGNPRSVDIARLTFGRLPGTAIEAEKISSLLTGARTFTQAQATETVVKANPNPRILHIATHGFFLKSAPETKNPDGTTRLPLENPLLRSGLAFAGFNVRQSGADDGVLTALEVTALDLRATQLVVMSACETGLGDVMTGEGVYGLRRAFTLAGAQAQLMTLWKIDDEFTKDLMINYYQRLQRGENRSEALRQAQLAALKSQNYQHPRYWSGFILSGDWRALGQ